MKTRDEIYSKEASELLRIITTYRILTYKQLLRLFPGRSKKIQAILKGFGHQGRILYDTETGIVRSADESNEASDMGMIDAFWVLLDFIKRAEYHTAGEFPVKISLFADAEMYEIVRICAGQEALTNHALSAVKDPPRRIIIVDLPSQVASINIPNTAGFCTVSSDGEIEYYSKGSINNMHNGQIDVPPSELRAAKLPNNKRT